MLPPNKTLSPRSQSTVGTVNQEDDVDSKNILEEYKMKFINLLITRLIATESARYDIGKQLDRSSPCPMNKQERSPSISQDGFSWNS